MIQRSLFLMMMMIISIQAAIDPMIDPKHELLSEVVGRYRIATRQLRESQSTLPLDIQFPVHDIIKIDVTTNEYLFRATIELNYRFEFLHWDANDTHNRYYDIDEIVLPKTVLQSLWLPDIHLIDEDFITFTNENETIKINRDGLVKWMRRGLFRIISPIDLTYYPFDRQYIRINLYNNEQKFKLQYQEKNLSKIHSHLPRLTNFWTKIFDKTENKNSSLFQQENNQTILSRGWFVQTLAIESKMTTNENLEKLSIYLLIQRRRESHIYTTILPTLFFSAFIFIYYFSSIESYQRLTIGLLHIFATLMFIIHLDRKISVEQLSSTPLIIRYLSIVFLLGILSLFFDHIIHSIHYGGLHFVSNWFRKKEHHQTQPARLSRIKLLTRGSRGDYVENAGGPDLLMKQLVEREESLKLEDYQRYQWQKRARLSECLCCWFFLIIIIVIFIAMFFIIPTLNSTKMT